MHAVKPEKKYYNRTVNISACPFVALATDQQT